MRLRRGTQHQERSLRASKPGFTPRDVLFQRIPLLLHPLVVLDPLLLVIVPGELVHGVVVPLNLGLARRQAFTGAHQLQLEPVNLGV